MSNKNWTSSGTIYTGTVSGTLSIPVFSGSISMSSTPEYECEHCKKIIKGKFIQLEIHLPIKRQPQSVPGTIWAYPYDKTKYFYFHLSCFINNTDKLKKLIILSEMLDES